MKYSGSFKITPTRGSVQYWYWKESPFETFRWNLRTFNLLKQFGDISTLSLTIL